MKNIKLILFGLLLCWSSSCQEEEFFELDYPVEFPWTTPTEFEKAAIGTYYSQTGNGGFGLFDSRRLFSIAISDEAVFVTQAGGDSDTKTLYDRDSDTEVAAMSHIFNTAYFTIGTANAGLKLFVNTDNPYPNFSSPNDLININRIRGELLFNRAFSYWSLAKAYCPPYRPGGDNSAEILPKRLVLPGNIDEANNSELFSTAELYDAIVADLVAAKGYLPLAYVAGVHHPSYAEGRATRFSAAALLARVYFQMGKQDEALAELDFVINQNGGRFDLSEDPIEAWNKITTSDRGKETVLFHQQADGDGLPNNGWKDLKRFELYNYSNRLNDNANSFSSIRSLAVSKSFLLKAGWVDANGVETQAARNDKRYTQLFKRVAGGTDPLFTDLNTGYLDGTGSLVWNNRYYAGSNRDQASLPVIRLAEMYLTRAIIRLNKGNLQGAADDLNVVRARAWNATAAGAAYTPLTAAEVTADLIHTERMIELAFEGDRPHYLQALQLSIPNGDRTAGQVAFDNPGLWFPIIQREKELNNAYSGN